MSKGDSTTTSNSQVELPKWLEKPARTNIKMAEAIAQKPYMPYTGPTQAAFTPMQVNSMQGTNEAAKAFGLPYVDTGRATNTNTVGSMLTGLPQPMKQGGGFSGYSGHDLAERSKRDLSDYERKFIDRFFFDPTTGGDASHPFLPKIDIGLKDTGAENRRKQAEYNRWLNRVTGDGGDIGGRGSTDVSSPPPNSYNGDSGYITRYDENGRPYRSY